MELDFTQDDLPLVANTSHILVRHYVLDLDVDFSSHVIGGSIVLFLEPGRRCRRRSNEQVEGVHHSQLDETFHNPLHASCYGPVPNARACSTKSGCNDFPVVGKGENDTSDKNGSHGNTEQASGISSSKNCSDIEIHGSEDFLLVLDCCDLSVLKVEEVDVMAVPGIEKFISSTKLMDASEDPGDLRNQIVHELVTLPADHWREQLHYYRCCSQAPASGELLFVTGPWSLEIKKAGVQLPKDFPQAIRIFYKTKPEGRSLSWTTDQSDRSCVYTIGSPINNRALFPCQEPPVAMSTWQATVRADACFVVLMSGENAAEPTESEEGRYSWSYYVTMPMPASTFTVAVGCWAEVKRETCGADAKRNDAFFPLSSKEDVSPHIIFLSQSTLPGGNHLCGTRLCHEIAHTWFGLAIGARDWTEEWLSEGFATHLEDAFWSSAQQLPVGEAKEQQDLKALLHWQRLRDEIQNSEEDLQVLRPNKENTGKVCESGASVIKHGLNTGKTFLQVHYLKGYFLLRSFAGKAGEAAYFAFLRKFVQDFHGQLILSQDFLHSLLKEIPQLTGYGLSVENVFQEWLDCSGIPKIRMYCSLGGDSPWDWSSFSSSTRLIVTSCQQLQFPLLEESQAWQEGRLAQQVNEEVAKWIQVNQRARKRSKKKRQCEEDVFQKLLPDQLVLVLEHLLKEKTLCSKMLECLQKTYHLREQDAEVRHRWCELVIKHKHTTGYGDVETFLKDDQAMGVYLYGELMVNEDANQQELAYKSFAAVRGQMDVSSAKIVAEMLL
ncbi:aminopeptidase O isoform X4 [Paroedura picta]|uniref:aminopeptidase O isoform X4 n=1 Tax=Paroedura picta TaxID=143630 RepID=UPI004055CF38